MAAGLIDGAEKCCDEGMARMPLNRSEKIRLGGQKAWKITNHTVPLDSVGEYVLHNTLLSRVLMFCLANYASVPIITHPPCSLMRRNTKVRRTRGT